MDSTSPPQDTLMDIPRYLIWGVKIIAKVDTGVVYLAKVEKPHTKEHEAFLAQVESDLLVLKIIYPGFGRQRYSREVHKILDGKNMAPKFYGIKFPVPKQFQNKASLEAYIYMEYLAPPSDSSPKGWISLYDLGVDHSAIAFSNKSRIMKAIITIITTLKEGRYVHSDFRPNNILIYVDITPSTSSTSTSFTSTSFSSTSASTSSASSCTLISQENTNLPFLKVIDFDWSGHANTNNIHYPAYRNPKVRWPGYNGQHIGADDDSSMVALWMREWPARILSDGGWEQGEAMENF